MEAVKVWKECRTQVIAGFGGIIDINILAVKMTMDMHGIRDQRACMEKVRLMFDEYRSAIEEKEERENAKSKD